jgi:hypothetical protein
MYAVRALITSKTWLVEFTGQEAWRLGGEKIPSIGIYSLFPEAGS